MEEELRYSVMRAIDSDWEESMVLAYKVFLKFESEEYPQAKHISVTVSLEDRRSFLA